MKKNRFQTIIVFSIVSLSFLSFSFLNTLEIDHGMNPTTIDTTTQESSELHMPDVYFLMDLVERVKENVSKH